MVDSLDRKPAGCRPGNQTHLNYSRKARSFFCLSSPLNNYIEQLNVAAKHFRLQSVK